ncbi:protein LSM14 homolog B-A-like [Oppia nitens]|uniref:protein LSM14 homolog B-A-like n=1 Tax=Oppia nitens TaxID=1686743 RepID=UPI0023D9C9FD|nr:protein LSM14 homolog B-A-like [Oppia nitens]
MSVTTTPFLGCKISLISKSEIRYEGILYTIDPKESTIALAKVRSYGTEDRPVERQVPPRDEIFEYIIFRAGDIKDLIVDDPPATIAPGLADPAIIQAHSTSSTSGATFPSTTFPEITRNSNSNSVTSGQRPSGAAFSSGQNAINSLTMGTGFKSSASNESRSQNSTPTTTGQQQQHQQQNRQQQSPHLDGQSSAAQQSNQNRQNIHKDNYKRNERSGQMPQMRRGGPQGGYGGGGGGNRDGGGGGGGHGPQQNYYTNRRGSGQPNYRQQNQSHSQPPQTNNRFGNYNNRQFNNNYSNINQRRPGGGQSRPQNRGGPHNRVSNRGTKEPIKFENDFDFEKGLEEFSEMEKKFSNLKVDTNNTDEQQPKEGDIKQEETNTTDNNSIENTANGDKENLENDPFYDKAKSFFDTISCEAIEREKGNVQRIDWKAERKLNSETFGVPMSYRRGFGRGRGGYGHRGYRSYYRGGGFSRGGSGGGGGSGDTRRYKSSNQQQNQRN